MGSIKQKLSCGEIRQWDMVPFLSRLGYEPVQVKRMDYWYLSPLRKENTPSFKVNRNINKWYDHGIGQGGNLIDFCLFYYQCSIPELLDKYDTGFPFQQPPFTPLPVTEMDSKITILGDFILTSFTLLHYLEDRCIELDIAHLYCREVRYQIGSKIYYAIGFKNDLGGFELRHSFFKGSSSPKGITTFVTGKDTNVICVFEGFFDFLSFLCGCKEEAGNVDYLILNSLVFFEQSRCIMDAYKQVLLFLDNDQAGQNCSAYALSLNPRYQSRSSYFAGYKDLNQWLVEERLRKTKDGPR
jgi:hypothetical protein